MSRAREGSESVSSRPLLPGGWKVLAVVAALGLALLASACGGDSAEGAQVASLCGSSTQADTETTTTGTSEDPQEILLDYSECMRKEGVDFPDPDFSGGPGGGARILLGPNSDPDDPKFQAAQEKCEPILANLRQQFDPAEQEERQEAALAFAKCMREHGIDMPDPDLSGDGPSRRREGGPFGDSGVDPDDPDFRAAQEECQEVFGERGGPFLGPRTQRRDAGDDE
jgi:hypothetical protein